MQLSHRLKFISQVKSDLLWWGVYYKMAESTLDLCSQHSLCADSSVNTQYTTVTCVWCWALITKVTTSPRYALHCPVWSKLPRFTLSLVDIFSVVCEMLHIFKVQSSCRAWLHNGSRLGLCTGEVLPPGQVSWPRPWTIVWQSRLTAPVCLPSSGALVSTGDDTEQDCSSVCVVQLHKPKAWIHTLCAVATNGDKSWHFSKVYIFMVNSSSPQTSYKFHGSHLVSSVTGIENLSMNW